MFIPRPETEVLIELCRALELPDDATIVEIGPGTGCIGLSLLTAFPLARLVAFDVNPKAVALTQKNAAALGVGDRADVREGNALEVEIPTCDLLVSNPPYVAADVIAGLEPEVRDHEPIEALTPGPDGMSFVRALMPRALAAVRPGGWIAMEHGHDQGPVMQELFAQSGLVDVEMRRDLGDRDRVAVGRRA